MNSILNLKGAKMLPKNAQKSINGGFILICQVFCPTYCNCIGDRCEYPDGRNCSAL